MLLVMAVTLYTSRVVLQALGVVDYGIYNVVGGVVLMFSFLNTALNTTTQRYLNFEMGRDNLEGMKNVFSMSFWGFLVVAVVAALLAETVGMWFINTQLNIPEDRMNAAIWTFHFSVAAFIINLITVPYNATIIAHEKMSIYAYISIGEVVLKLLMIFGLLKLGGDKLILYSFLMLMMTLLVAIAYYAICKNKFEECKLLFKWDKKMFMELFAFSGWMQLGSITNILSTQGVNILVNIFFGPVFNASRGIAVQVNSAISAFVANFMTAVRPQIVKSYAQKDMVHMYNLVFTSSKVACYLLLILVLPLIFNASDILSLWLGEVPPMAVLFTQLTLINLVIISAYSPIAYVTQAAGNIRDYQIVISCCFIIIAALTWVGYLLKMPVETTFYVSIIIDTLGLFARLKVLKKIVDFPIMAYWSQVILPILLVILISVIYSAVIKIFIDANNIWILLLSLIIMVTGIIIIVWVVGISSKERELLSQYASKILHKNRFV